ncbi:MAG: hypothetical protein ACFFDH_21130 [Promethearchaeota archaeon]
MPTGLIFMKYDERSGMEIKAKYPEENLEISDKTLMHILNLHEFSEEAGLVSLTLDNVNFVTYYTGSANDFFIILKLNILEEPEDYEVILEEISQTILKNLDKDKYLEILPSLFNRIREYPKKKNNLIE